MGQPAEIAETLKQTPLEIIRDLYDSGAQDVERLTLMGETVEKERTQTSDLYMEITSGNEQRVYNIATFLMVQSTPG